MDSKTVALLLALLGAAAIFLAQQAPSKRSVFESWKANHTIYFTSETENIYREKIFHENLAKIEAHNAQKDRTYAMGLNQFSAMTEEQFAQTYLTLAVPEHKKIIDSTDDLKVGAVDWVAQGAVTGIKNQGSCGSCWAFSTTGALEGLSKLAYGKLQSFSEQQLIDCSSSYGNHGCNGGLMDNAFKFVKDYGIVTQEEYPYTGRQGTCKISSGSFKVSGFTDIRSCNDLALAVASRPVSVAVDATNWSKYSSGVFNNCKTSLNHGVTLVGISDNSWTIKNSWGNTWGEKGFIRLSRGNTCGVCNAASFPLK